MRRRITAALPALAMWSAIAAGAQDWRAEVDPRIELMSILFRLAGNSEYRQCRIPAYDRAIDSYFGRYRDHEAVQSARALAVGFDAPMKIAVYLRDVYTLAERVPFDRLSAHPFVKWDAAQARGFLGAARRFAADAKIEGFLSSQQPLYSATNARLEAFLRDQADPGWLTRFFGPPAPAEIVVVPGLSNGASSYAARAIDETGAEEIYAIPGVSKVGADGLPVFDADWGATMALEIAHPYASRAVDKFAPEMAKAASQIFQAVAPAMRRQSCGDWKAMLKESLAHAAAIEYVMERLGPQAARDAVRKENAHSFFWMSGLVNLLDAYRKDRQRYPTLESFMPLVVNYFNETAPRMQQILDRLQPKVISASVAQGARNVDPGLMAITVRFSMAMNRAGPGKTAKLSGGRFDQSGTAVTIPVTLEPEREYAIPLRWAGGQPFRSANGVPLPDTVLRFQTGAAAAPKQP